MLIIEKIYPAQRLGNTTLTVEAKYPINFTELAKIFV